jgi:hypothetical protein
MRRLVAEAAAEWSDRRCVLASALFGAGAGGPLGTNWAQTAVTVCHPPWNMNRVRRGPVGLRRGTWRRFDPSSSPSANDPRAQISTSINRPKISQQSGVFRELQLYWRLPSCGIFGSETAFFSRASDYVDLV